MSVSTHILLVEDEDAHAELIRHTFAIRARHVTTSRAHSLEQARRLLDEVEPDLVLSDLRLPDGNGVELLPDHGAQADFPVVIMTSLGDENVAVEAMKRGALDYVVKSDRTLLDLPRIVERALREWRHIIERRQAEEALRASEEKFSKAFRSSPDAITISRLRDGLYLDVNEGFERLSGYSREEAVGQTGDDLDIWYEEDRARLVEVLNRCGVIRDMEIVFRTKTGDARSCTVAAEIIELDGEPCIVAVTHDITARKRLEKELLEISGREQRRIGFDLHDGLGQLLTGIGFRLAEVERDLIEDDRPEAEDVAEIGQFVVDAIEQTRSMARVLNPIMTEKEGLSAALATLAINIEQVYGISCVFVSGIAPRMPDVEAATHVYRIVQEAATNAVRHGSATRITITLSHAGDVATIAIEDNGSGIPDVPKRSGGMGLRIMEYRARMIGGTLSIARSAGGGTLVTCTFPAPAVHDHHATD